MHGGATSLHSKDIGNSFQRRKQLNVSSKRSIVQMAIEYLYQDCVISLDARSTNFYLAQAIPCTVITNSMHNIRALVAKEKIKTIATGGTYSDKYDAFYGPLSETLLQRLHIDIGFFSCSAIDNEGGLWESNELNVAIKKKMFNQCEQAFLLADSSKLNKKNLVHLLDLNEMDIFFTDQILPEELKNYCDQNELLVSIPE